MFVLIIRIISNIVGELAGFLIIHNLVGKLPKPTLVEMLVLMGVSILAVLIYLTVEELIVFRIFGLIIKYFVISFIAKNKLNDFLRNLTIHVLLLLVLAVVQMPLMFILNLITTPTLFMLASILPFPTFLIIAFLYNKFSLHSLFNFALKITSHKLVFSIFTFLFFSLMIGINFNYTNTTIIPLVLISFALPLLQKSASIIDNTIDAKLARRGEGELAEKLEQAIENENKFKLFIAGSKSILKRKD